MPTYDFVCGACEHRAEKLMKIAEMEVAIDIECPECGALRFNRTYDGAVNYAFMSPESLGRHKAPSDFRNFLSAIKKAHPGCAIRDH